MAAVMNTVEAAAITGSRRNWIWENILTHTAGKGPAPQYMHVQVKDGLSALSIRVYYDPEARLRYPLFLGHIADDASEVSSSNMVSV